MIGLVLIVLVGAVALVMVASDSDDDDSGRTETAERNEGDDEEPTDTSGTDNTSEDGTGGEPGPSASTVTTPDATSPPRAPTTSTTPRAPAQAAVGDCVEVTPNGNLLGTGACSPAGPPYKVTAVVGSPSECPSPYAGYTPSGDYLLCLEFNLFETYCYVLGEDWITPATTCQASGTVHVIDIVPGATTDANCTRDLQWNRWYALDAPQMVVCVMEY